MLQLQGKVEGMQLMEETDLEITGYNTCGELKCLENIEEESATWESQGK